VFVENNISISYFAEFGRTSTDDYIRSLLLKLQDFGRSKMSPATGGVLRMGSDETPHRTAPDRDGPNIRDGTDQTTQRTCDPDTLLVSGAVVFEGFGGGAVW